MFLQQNAEGGDSCKKSSATTVDRKTKMCSVCNNQHEESCQHSIVVGTTLLYDVKYYQKVALSKIKTHINILRVEDEEIIKMIMIFMFDYYII